MKCVVEDKALNRTVVFETSKITCLKKEYNSADDDYCLTISFDNGQNESFYFCKAEERDEEYDRIMKCWRSDEIEVNIGPLTA